jgi:hypothetical protein
VATPSSATVEAVAPHPFAPQPRATPVLDLERPGSAVRPLRRALDAIADVGALLLVVWLIPFVILAVLSPMVLILAILALIHRL